jgi:hypothetical protein
MKQLRVHDFIPLSHSLFLRSVHCFFVVCIDLVSFCAFSRGVVYLSIREFPCFLPPPHLLGTPTTSSLYQEQAVFGKMKMDPAKRAQTQNVGEV